MKTSVSRKNSLGKCRAQLSRKRGKLKRDRVIKRFKKLRQQHVFCPLEHSSSMKRQRRKWKGRKTEGFGTIIIGN